MSISIHNGFRLTNHTPESLQSAMDSAFSDFLLQRAHQEIFADALYFHDLATVGPEPLAIIYQRLTSLPLPFDGSWESLWAVAYAKNNEEDFFHRYLSAKAVFIEGKDGFDYALVYGVGVEEIFEGIEGVEEFPYWNSSEQPDGMTEEQWAERLETWESVLDFKRSVESQGTVVQTQVEPVESLASVCEYEKTCFEMREDSLRLWRLAADFAVYNAGDLKKVSDIISVISDDVAMNKYADELAPGLLPISHETIVEGIDTRAY